MNESARRSGVVVALALLIAPQAASAVDIESGHLEAGYAWGLERPADGGPRAQGIAAAARVPFSQNWFVAGEARRLEPYTDAFDGRHPEENRLAIGLGVRRGARGRELFGQITYLDVDHFRDYADPPRVRGGALSFGARNMISSRVELGLEGGMGYVEGGRTHDLLVMGRGSLAYRLVPHLWLFGEATLAFFEESMGRAGLRFSFPGPQPPRLPPAVKAAEPGEPPALAVGANVVVQRELQLQARPAFGAPETIVVPVGGTLSLLETTANKFGNWWRVAYGDQQGWIREGHLK